MFLFLSNEEGHINLIHSINVLYITGKTAGFYNCTFPYNLSLSLIYVNGIFCALIFFGFTFLYTTLWEQ